MAKSLGGKAAKLALAAVGAAALGTVCTGAAQFVKWAKDPYSTELWFGFLKKGILITKTDEPHHYRVQTGFRWHSDGEAGEAPCEEEETVMEIPLPEERDMSPEAEEEAAPETVKEAEAAPEEPEAGNEA